ncbi:MAG: hypothetical protein ABL893_11115, partial [Hyphomicrobium sp.]
MTVRIKSAVPDLDAEPYRVIVSKIGDQEFSASPIASFVDHVVARAIVTLDAADDTAIASAATATAKALEATARATSAESPAA